MIYPWFTFREQFLFGTVEMGFSGTLLLGLEVGLHLKSSGREVSTCPFLANMVVWFLRPKPERIDGSLLLLQQIEMYY